MKARIHLRKGKFSGLDISTQVDPSQACHPGQRVNPYQTTNEGRLFTSDNDFTPHGFDDSNLHFFSSDTYCRPVVKRKVGTCPHLDETCNTSDSNGMFECRYLIWLQGAAIRKEMDWNIEEPPEECKLRVLQELLEVLGVKK